MAEVVGFDVEGFQVLAAQLEGGPNNEMETTGSLLAAAIAAAELRAGSDGPVEEFNRVCDGMCVSNAMREAGYSVLQTAVRLSAPASAAGALERGFAAACGRTEAELCLHVQVWDALLLCAPRAGPREATSHRQNLALAVARRMVTQQGRAFEDIMATNEALSLERPPIKGGVLGTPGLLEVPPMLRRSVMILLEVSLRLLRHAEPLESAEHLEALFVSVPALRKALASSVWFEEDGKTLREEFRPAKKGKKGK